MQQKKWVKEHGAGCATMLRCLEPWHGSGRLALGDSALASLRTAMALAGVGLFFIGNVKKRDRRNSRGRGITGGELEQLNHYLIYLPSYISASNSGKRRCRACGALTAWCCACSPPPLASNSSSGKGRYASGLPLCNKGECMGFAKHCAGLPLKDTKRMRVTDDLEQT